MTRSVHITSCDSDTEDVSFILSISLSQSKSLIVGPGPLLTRGPFPPSSLKGVITTPRPVKAGPDRLTTAAGGAAGVAFETGAVADHRELPALGAHIPLVPL